MRFIKTVKVIFYLTALLLAAKPFIGFAAAKGFNSPIKTNIFAKIFSKRVKENTSSDFHSIQRKLAQPLSNFVLLFSFLLSLLFPEFPKALKKITAAFLKYIHLHLVPLQLNLFSGQFLI